MDRDGFSLLELLIALTIIGLAILPMIMIIAREKVLDRQLEMKNLGLELARSEIEWAKNRAVLPEEKVINLDGNQFVIIYEIDKQDLIVSVRKPGDERDLITLRARHR
ncbi:hypothetical protein DRP53_03185 [candidate division WOR-3 bacterium]|uniref:Prepilin-type N-terminal cleavage/methylation domain-containing protein n=1 Tax=candidate division WOR-3 bacterium TaxID=2052148 RepID=A0A660SLT8_UNCW3|nr:MAG: hypothetical protein DRP53_03185 [candidate division WOR-3 bacterium]